MNTNDVYTLCNKYRWFTGGNNRQYDKLFDMVKADASIHDIALVIWLCTPGETAENIENVIRQNAFDYMKACGTEMRNRRFECFCEITPDITANIKQRAKGAEAEQIEDWWTWVYKTEGLNVSEQDFCNMVDIEMPELAERCAKEITDNMYNAYLISGYEGIAKYIG